MVMMESALRKLAVSVKPLMGPEATTYIGNAHVNLVMAKKDWVSLQEALLEAEHVLGCSKTRLMEEQVLRALVTKCLAEGCSICVEDPMSDEPHVYSSDMDVIMSQLWQADEDTLYIRDAEGAMGWVMLTYGEDGWDVICDYSMGLERRGLMTEANKIANELAGV